MNTRLVLILTAMALGCVDGAEFADQDGGLPPHRSAITGAAAVNLGGPLAFSPPRTEANNGCDGNCGLTYGLCRMQANASALVFMEVLGVTGPHYPPKCTSDAFSQRYWTLTLAPAETVLGTTSSREVVVLSKSEFEVDLMPGDQVLMALRELNDVTFGMLYVHVANGSTRHPNVDLPGSLAELRAAASANSSSFQARCPTFADSVMDDNEFTNWAYGTGGCHSPSVGSGTDDGSEGRVEDGATTEDL